MSISAPGKRVSIPGRLLKVRAHTYRHGSLPPVLDYEQSALSGANLSAAASALQEEAMKNFTEKMDEGDAGEIWLDLVRHAGRLLLHWQSGRRLRTILVVVLASSIVAGALTLATILYRGLSLPCLA
jgi:hypothetical protein